MTGLFLASMVEVRRSSPQSNTSFCGGDLGDGSILREMWGDAEKGGFASAYEAAGAQLL
jgi:hypothetical protein